MSSKDDPPPAGDTGSRFQILKGQDTEKDVDVQMAYQPTTVDNQSTENTTITVDDQSAGTTEADLALRQLHRQLHPVTTVEVEMTDTTTANTQSADNTPSIAGMQPVTTQVIATANPSQKRKLVQALPPATASKEDKRAFIFKEWGLEESLSAIEPASDDLEVIPNNEAWVPPGSTSAQIDLPTFKKLSLAPTPIKAQKAPEFDYHNIHNPIKNIPAIVMVIVKKGNDYYPVGRHMGRHGAKTTPQLIDVKCSIDAGRYGRPSLTISFIMKNGNRIKATFKTGSKSPFGGYQIDNLRSSTVKEREAVAEIPTLVYQAHKDDGEAELAKVAFLGFDSHGSEAQSHVEESLWADEEEEIQQQLLLMFNRYDVAVLNGGKLVIQCWLVLEPSVAKARINWLDYLQKAVATQLPQLHQYPTKKDGTLILDGIREIEILANKMYLNHAQRKDKNGKNILDGNGVSQMDTLTPLVVHQFDVQYTFPDLRTLGIFIIVPVVREIHQLQRQCAGLGLEPHRVLFQEVKPLKGIDLKVKNRMTKSFKCWVRFLSRKMEENSRPPVHSRCVVEIDNSDKNGGAHLADKNMKFHGTVMEVDAKTLRQVQADFCLWLSKPRGIKDINALKALVPTVATGNNLPSKLPSAQFGIAHIEVEIDHQSANRQLKGGINFVNPYVDGVKVPFLQTIRDIIMKRVDEAPKHRVNLVPKDHLEWFENVFLKRMETEYQDAPFDFQRLFTDIRAGLALIMGPPGCGKTTTLINILTGLLHMKLRTVVAAVSNKAVNKAAIEAYNKVKQLKDTDKSTTVWEETMMIRLDTLSIELRATRKMQDYQGSGYGELKAEQLHQPATDKEDPTVFEALSKAADSFIENENDWSKLQKMRSQVLSFTRALAQMQRYVDTRTSSSGIPLSMTMSYNSWKVLTRNQHEAEEEYQSEFDALENKNDPTTVAALKPVIDRRPGLKYKQLLQEWITEDGNFPKPKRDLFNELREEHWADVLRQADVLFVTVNNCGNNVVERFEPDVLIGDEGGQWTLADFTLAFGAFVEKLRAVLIFGDPNQLLPYLLSLVANELRKNAQLSFLAMMIDKKWEKFMLKYQRRSAPPLIEFVARHVYGGELFNHPCQLDRENEPARVAIRRIAKENYAICNEKNPDGRETWFVDVKYGISRVKDNSNSRYNKASATAVAEYIIRLLLLKIMPKDIIILIYYLGQKPFIYAALVAVAAKSLGKEDRALIDDIEISSIDAFQGDEREHVVVDTVVGLFKVLTDGQQAAARHDKTDETHPVSDDEEEDDERYDASNPTNQRVTAHVKLQNRMCCALTRAKTSCVVFGQLAALLGNFKKGKPAHAMHAMCEDFMNRQLISADGRNMDDESMRDLTAAQEAQIKRQQDTFRQHMMEGQLRRAINVHSDARTRGFGSYQGRGGQGYAGRGRGGEERGGRGGRGGAERGRGGGQSGAPPFTPGANDNAPAAYTIKEGGSNQKDRKGKGKAVGGPPATESAKPKGNDWSADEGPAGRMEQ